MKKLIAFFIAFGLCSQVYALPYKFKGKLLIGKEYKKYVDVEEEKDDVHSFDFHLGINRTFPLSLYTNFLFGASAEKYYDVKEEEEYNTYRVEFGLEF